MKAKILALLREKKTYVSGQQLSEEFGVSRTAVWKAINRLKKEGYRIDAVPKKGYLLREPDAETATGAASWTEQKDGDARKLPTEIYTRDDISSRLCTEWAGRTLYFYDVTGSTNAEVKRLAEEGALHGTVVVADMQTAGRGRRGRSWDSPAGTNIYFSILLKPDFAPDRASMLTLVIAHAIARCFRETLGLDATCIKWPNDIVIDGKKTCGILTEMSVEQDYIQYVVIGVGINVRRQTFPAEIADRAIALDEAATVISMIDRSKLLADILKFFEEDYEKFLQTDSMKPLQAFYNEMLVNRDREVCVLDPAGEYRGIAKGITETGELIVELPDGSRRRVYAGEVSVRGIYGYV